jgi:hypothetical protein
MAWGTFAATIDYFFSRTCQPAQNSKAQLKNENHESHIA